MLCVTINNSHWLQDLQSCSNTDMDKDLSFGNLSISMDNYKTGTVRIKRQAEKELSSVAMSIFNETGSGGLALGNPLIMEKIVSCLDYKELDCWYNSSVIFKHILDKMDHICWGKRAEKIARELKITKDVWDLQLSGNTFREVFYDFLTKQIQCKLEEGHYRRTNPSVVTEAAMLAHQGVLRPLTILELWRVDLASVPTQHLCSLLACVTDRIILGCVWSIDLSHILDHVKCRELRLIGQMLGTEDTQALVRAMRFSVQMVNIGSMPLGLSSEVDFGTLTNYDGKGECILVECSENAKHIYKDNLRSWAKQINWDVEDNSFSILIKQDAMILNILYNLYSL